MEVLSTKQALLSSILRLLQDYYATLQWRYQAQAKFRNPLAEEQQMRPRIELIRDPVDG